MTKKTPASDQGETMEHAGDTAQESVFAEFDIADIEAPDEVEMTVMVGDKPTNWVWTFAGHAHPKTIEQANRISRETLAREKAMEMARVNGKKWKGEDTTVQELRERNVNFVLERLIGWTPVKFNGEDYPFSIENARKLLMDRKRISLLTQALEFLGDEKSFMKRSANS